MTFLKAHSRFKFRLNNSRCFINFWTRTKPSSETFYVFETHLVDQGAPKLVGRQTINFDPRLRIKLKVHVRKSECLYQRFYLRKTWCGPAAPRLCLHQPQVKLDLRPAIEGSLHTNESETSGNWCWNTRDNLQILKSITPLDPARKTPQSIPLNMPNSSTTNIHAYIWSIFVKICHQKL